jgi:hypothetical protein
MATTLRHRRSVGEVSAIADEHVAALTLPLGAAMIKPSALPRWPRMRLGKPAAFRGLAIFVVIVAAMLALKERGMPDFTGALWWIAVLAGSLYFLWQSWRAGGWEKLKRTKLSRWMLGEDDVHP